MNSHSYKHSLALEIDSQIRCRTYKCISQTVDLDDWLGPWISFLWLLFLFAFAFAVRMLYKTYVKFRNTISNKENGELMFKPVWVDKRYTS